MTMVTELLQIINIWLNNKNKTQNMGENLISK